MSKGTIPKGQNSPRCVRFGLYAEQMTASAFVAPRHLNKKAWLYRARPAVAHQGFVRDPFGFPLPYAPCELPIVGFLGMNIAPSSKTWGNTSVSAEIRNQVLALSDELQVVSSCKNRLLRKSPKSLEQPRVAAPLRSRNIQKVHHKLTTLYRPIFRTILIPSPTSFPSIHVSIFHPHSLLGFLSTFPRMAMLTSCLD